MDEDYWNNSPENAPGYQYKCAWFPNGIQLPEPETAMSVPPKGEHCVVAVVTLFYTAYYDVVGCTSAKLIYKHR